MYTGASPFKYSVELPGSPLMCLLTVGWRAAVAETPLAVFPINEKSIAQMHKQHTLALAEVNDPVYKRERRYQGLWLRDVLKDFGQGRHPETEPLLSAALRWSETILASV